MDVRRLEALPPPPGVIASLQAGFSIVSSRIALILLPFVLNVLLWLGPRLSVGNWVELFLTSWVDFLRRNGFPAQEIMSISTNAPGFVDFVERLNWLGWLRTFPIGMPVLMLNLPEGIPVQIPVGAQAVIQLSSFLAVMGTCLLLTILGWLGGGWYFRIVAGASLGEPEPAISLIWIWLQTILLSVVWLIGLSVIVFPMLLLIGLLLRIHPLLAQTAFFIILFFLFWLVVPLFFMPHGIFVRRQNAFLSILSSLRMSRVSAPNNSLFVLSVFLLSRGLSYLWLVPPSESWLMLIGIAGHAFISTALLSASFVYYRNMNYWLQTVYEPLLQLSKQSSSVRKV